MMHEIFTTAIVHSTPYYALGLFGANERIDDVEHARLCIKEIGIEQKHSDTNEIELLNRVKRFIVTAPYGQSLSRSKIKKNGEYEWQTTCKLW